jgi:putative transcriptional regulator
LNGPNSVVTIKDYGCISFHFDKIMDAKGITRNKLAMLTGIRFEVADRLYKGIIERMDMDVLARVCFVLDCQVGDIIKYDK